MLSALRPIVELLEGAATDAAWMGYLDGYHEGWKAAGKRGKPPDVSDERLTAAADHAYGRGNRLSEALERLAVELAGMARTPRDALASFAEDELGVTLDVLLGAWARPAIDTLAAHAEALDAVEPDAEGLALLGDVLRVAWRRHGLQDDTAEIDDELRARFETALRRADDADGTGLAGDS
jgi:hypothetical protein